MQGSFIALEWKEMIHQKFRLFHFFCDFGQQSFWSVKLTTIPGRTTNTTFCSPQTYCLSLVNKNTFSGFNDEIFAKFWVYVPKQVKFWANFGKIFAGVSRKFKFFYLCEIMVPSFHLSLTVLGWNKIIHKKI